MSISNRIIRIADHIKPVLIKLLPIELLRKLKSRMVFRSYQKIAAINAKPFVRNKYQDGVNLIGNIRAEIGLGQSCRLVANELNESRLEFTIYRHEAKAPIRMNDNTWVDKISPLLPYNINLIHMNPYELGLAYVEFKRTVWENRYNIVFWLWELEELPPRWVECIPCIDEIWTPSEFVSNTMKKYTDKPVVTMPYYVTAPVESRYDRKFFNLPEGIFLFLMMYDSNSTMGRKNPLGAVESYKKAFSSENEEVGIIIKINNVLPEDLELIKKMLIGYRNVYYITEVLEKSQVNSLIKCADVFVSLHRAEGFGLVLAEAMLLGTPTIATNWSANIEFMTHETACLVDFELVTIETDHGLYQQGGRWAEPDISEAAAYMLRLYQDKEFYSSISTAGQAHAQCCLSREKALKNLEGRIEEIYERERKLRGCL